MKFVILSNKIIPGFGVKGPVMSPAEYDIHLVLKWITARIDVREVMEDGSYRKLSCNDERLMEELYKKQDKTTERRRQVNEAKKEVIREQQCGNVRLIPEAKPLKVDVKPKAQPKVEEKPKEEPVQPKVKEPEKNNDLIIDELEKP